jgi:hypothetical protein
MLFPKFQVILKKTNKTEVQTEIDNFPKKIRLPFSLKSDKETS